jgi:hypothetical protein
VRVTTKTRVFTGVDETRAVASYLVDFSVWFEVTPMPFEQWEVTVKGDAESALDRAGELAMEKP